MPTYVWRDGELVDKHTGEAMNKEGEGKFREIIELGKPPFAFKNMPEYRSPIDGRLITSRHERQEDLKRNGCVEAEPKKPRGYKNPHFAKKRGLNLQTEK